VTEPDVVVIGGGPAGLAAAIVCATHGLTTRMVERHPSPVDKPCGEGLLPNGVAALARIGIEAELVAAHAQAIVGIRYHTPQGRMAEASFEGPTGLGIRRTDLSRVLFAHARTLPGLAVVTGEAAVAAVDDSGRPRVRAAGTTYRPKLVIGADGLHSRTRDSVGIAVERRGHSRWGCRQHFDGEPWTDHVEVYFARGFEVYVTPVARGVNVAVLWDTRVVHPPAGRSPVASLVAQVPALAPQLIRRAPSDPARAGGPFDVRVRRPWRLGVLLIGDAAGYVDALTGEGVGVALEQAALLSSTVVPALRRTPHGAVIDSDALARFAQAARSRSRSNRLLTRVLVRIAQHPALVEGIVGALASSPTLFAHLLDVNMGRRKIWRVPLPSFTFGEEPSR